MASERKLLRWVAIVALVDFLLLIPLVIGAFAHDESLTSILGPIHGVGFLLELGLAMRGSAIGYWGWWFPAIVVITLGPLGALIGHHRLTRQWDA